MFLTNVHPHQAIGVNIQVFRAISLGFKTVGDFKIIQFIHGAPVRDKIFAQIFGRDSESGSLFQIVISDKDNASTRRNFLEIFVRNTSGRNGLQLKIFASFFVGDKTLRAFIIICGLLQAL